MESKLSSAAAIHDRSVVLENVSKITERMRLGPFYLEGSWRMRWAFCGSTLRIEVNTEADKIATKAEIYQVGSGGGSSYQSKGGTYYLDVWPGSGNWVIDVVSPAGHEQVIAEWSGNAERPEGIVSNRFVVDGPWELMWVACEFSSVLLWPKRPGLQKYVFSPAEEEGNAGTIFRSDKAGEYEITAGTSGDFYGRLIRLGQ